jgi:DNA-binding GntR family transcriptional regulator
MSAATLPVPRAPARHRVRDWLESQILTGRRPPGTKIRQQEIADKLGVAVPVIREALVELQSLGLVEIHDNRGAFVTQFTRKRLLDSFDIREGIEGIAARLCCQNMSRAQVRELSDLAEQIYQASQSGRLEEANRLDREFHERLLNYSANELLPRLVRQFRWVIKIVWSYHDPEETRRTHLAILEAIEANRPDDAERAMRQHIRVSRELTERQLARKPEGVHWISEER